MGTTLKQNERPWKELIINKENRGSHKRNTMANKYMKTCLNSRV